MKNKGFTLGELAFVLAILSVLFIQLVPRFSKQNLNANIDSTESDLRTFSIDLNNYVIDYGRFVIDPSNPNYADEVRNFVQVLNDYYLSFSLEESTITIADDNTSFSVDTKIKKDPWNVPYRMYVYTSPSDDIGGLMVISSAGPDTVFNIDDYFNNPELRNFDDILLIIEPKL